MGSKPLCWCVAIAQLYDDEVDALLGIHLVVMQLLLWFLAY